MSKVLVSSDHHANWEALKYWFSYASKNILPFIIAGDVVGDYNFEELASQKNLSLPDKYTDNENTKSLRKLYEDILKFHAKKFSEYIEEFQVKTYFLHGNHEPITFGDMVKTNLENKELFVDMNKTKGFIEISKFNVAGISNTCQLMPFLEVLYSTEELDRLFPHQRTPSPIITNLTKDKVSAIPNPEDDYEWIRITTNQSIEELDIFVTHGQIGIGAWRKEKKANELPTLLSAAKLSLNAKLTVDGHLHTTHTMKNDLGKPTIRAVGNNAFLVEKLTDGKLTIEQLESSHPYDARGGIKLKDLQLIKSPIDKFLEE